MFICLHTFLSVITSIHSIYTCNIRKLRQWWKYVIVQHQPSTSFYSLHTYRMLRYDKIETATWFSVTDNYWQVLETYHKFYCLLLWFKYVLHISWIGHFIQDVAVFKFSLCLLVLIWFWLDIEGLMHVFVCWISAPLFSYILRL